MTKSIILISTYNGETFLSQQIDSIISQSQKCNLLVRDDGSKDGTQDLLKAYQQKGILQWYTGENLRPAKSFWNLLQNAPKSDYYAFSDQDDVWMEDKLLVATDMMKDYEDVPCLYFSAKRLVDKDLNLIADTKDNFLLTLGEAMIYNPVTGCTMVINKVLREILLSANPVLPSLHDSWIYRTCLAVGGKVIYDSIPHIKYRQHGNNVVGHVGLYGRLKAFLKSLTGPKLSSARSNTAKELLRCYGPKMTVASREMLILLSEYDRSVKKKLRLIFNSEMKTSSLSGRLTFILYVLFNKY